MLSPTRTIIGRSIEANRFDMITGLLGDPIDLGISDVVFDLGPRLVTLAFRPAVFVELDRSLRVRRDPAEVALDGDRDVVVRRSATVFSDEEEC